MLSHLFVILFLLSMILFIVYHFYVDYSNWSNTGNTFAEGMTGNVCITEDSCKKVAESLGLKIGGGGYAFAGSYSPKGLYAYKSGKYSGIAFFGKGGTEAQMKQPINNSTKYRPTPPQQSSGATTSAITDATSCSGWDCEIEGQFCPMGVPGASSGNFLCKDKKWVKVVGRPTAAAPAAALAAAPSAAPSAEPNNLNSKEVINRQTQSRAGINTPMESSVPQNCKPGCVAPNGPSGNCKDIQQQGKPKKSCPYTCFNPTLEPNKCQYEQDCNSCGTRIFNPDDEPNMPPKAPEITGQPGGSIQDLRNKSNLNTIPVLERAIATGSKNITNFEQHNFGPEKIKQLQQPISMGNIFPPPVPPPTGTQPSVQEQMALDNWTRYVVNSMMRIKNQQVPSFVATGPAATFSKDWTPNRNESDSVSPMPTQLALQLQQQIKAGTIPAPPSGSPQAIALTAALGRDQVYNTQTRIQPNASSWGNTSTAPPMQPLASQSPNNPLFTPEIMKTVLGNKNLIPVDINITQDKQSNFIRIGKGFMQDLSNIRNVSLPNIDNDDFESLGRVIAKIKIQEAEKIDGPQSNVTKQRLINSVNNILAGSTISNSQVDWEVPRSTAKMTTTGMYNDNSNSMFGYGNKAAKHHTEQPQNGLCLWKGCEKNEKGIPYDSIYSLY